MCRRPRVFRSDHAIRCFAARLLMGLALGLGLLVVSGVGGIGSADAGAAPPRDRSAAARTPYGEMNLAWTEPGMIGLVGWAKDPDVDRPIDVIVAITDGGGLHRRTAGVYNPFLPGRTAQKYRSYLIAIPVSPGPKTMCVAALNVGRGAAHRLLGCSTFVVPAADPVGSVENVVPDASGDAVVVSGWALDPESSTSLTTTVTVDGVAQRSVVASGQRPDLAASYPGKGTAHGFSVSVPAAPGPRRVCVLATNVGRGADSQVGCRTVDVPTTVPIGAVEGVTTSADGVRITGWASDLDAASINVRITDGVDGAFGDPAVGLHGATGPRDDIAATTGRARATGFDVTLPVTTPGTHLFCVEAVNAGPGRDRFLGCFAVGIADRRPLVGVDALTLSGNTVRLRGWAVDRVGSAPVTVRVAVDGFTTTQVASIARPDIAASVPGARGDTGFDITIPGLTTGSHQICPRYSGTGGGVAGAVSGDRVASCSSVVIGSPSALASTPTWTGSPVGPEGGPLVDIDRDAGVSTRLRDGSVLWLFGDSSARGADGSLKYFVSGTGAWAPAGRPTVTFDAVTPDGKPYVLAAPGPGFPGCTLSGATPATWPMSAVTVPSGALDRVIVFLANMCLVDENTFEFRGVAVGEWFFDPANPPIGRPVQLSIVNAQMGMARSWGTAAVMGGDGLLYVYQCDRPANPANLGGFGPCRVARVDPQVVGDPASYRFWNGSSWVSGDPGTPMDLPAGTAAGYRYPASSFSVIRLDNGGFAMAYSPWPGFVDRLAVRFARSPAGPWTSPLEVELPGCRETVGGTLRSCYAVTLQPAAGSPVGLGIGWYDQATPPDRRGRYLISAMPLQYVGW